MKANPLLFWQGAQGSGNQKPYEPRFNSNAKVFSQNCEFMVG